MHRLGRIITTLIAVIVFLWAPGLIATAHALDYPPGFKLIQVPDPLDGHNPAYPLPKQKEPALGKPFFDPKFGTILTRVTSRGRTRHEYSRFDPFNADNSMIVMVGTDSGWNMIYRAKGPNYVDKQNLITKVDWNEPRWDPKDPRRLWGFDGFKIVTMDVPSGRVEVVKDFAQDPVLGKIIKSQPDLYRITTKDEGEPSLDFRYWALALQGKKEQYRIRHLFCWDRELDKVVGHMPLTAEQADPFNWMGMSPLGNWVIVSSVKGKGGKTSGLNIVAPDFSQWHRLAISTAHSDVGLDSLGREVIVKQNSATDYIELIPLDPKAKPVDSPSQYSGGMVRPMVRLFYANQDPKGFSGSMHICCNVPGYCVVSTYCSPKAPERNWLDRSIILLKLDPDKPKAYNLAKVHNTTGKYWEETQGTMTRDGSRIVWASNWGKDPGDQQVFMLELTMPPNWQEQLK